MRIAFFIIIVLCFFSCADRLSETVSPTSKWMALKDSFANHNLSEFTLDKQLYNTYRKFHNIQSKRIDSSLSEEWAKVYLYSWQERDPEFIEFTAIIEEEDRGVRMVYYVFNQKDSLLSATKVAAGSMEAEYEFATYSKFKSKDTLLTTMAMTQWFDMKKRGKLKITKGDTVLVEYTINKNGSITERTILERKELNLDE
ncbi:MAG: hypothetical protein K2Q24_03730 [Chitinophagaceae bacterium]|nr:hypothetical protein [Chitinophagaceae bacterium]